MEVVDGLLTVEMQGQVLQLSVGDVAFVPAGTPFRYWSEVAYTQFLYVGGGKETLDQALIEAGEKWEYPVFPVGSKLP